MVVIPGHTPFARKIGESVTKDQILRKWIGFNEFTVTLVVTG